MHEYVRAARSQRCVSAASWYRSLLASSVSQAQHTQQIKRSWPRAGSCKSNPTSLMYISMLQWRTPANQEWPRSNPRCNPACCPPRCGLCHHSKPANVAASRARSCATRVLRATAYHHTSKCCLRPTRFAQQVALYKYHSQHHHLTPLGGTILLQVMPQLALGRALATTGIAASPSAYTTHAGSSTTRALFDFPACKWCISTCAGACSKQRWQQPGTTLF